VWQAPAFNAKEPVTSISSVLRDVLISDFKITPLGQEKNLLFFLS
jgi:hypothetical protein